MQIATLISLTACSRPRSSVLQSTLDVSPSRDVRTVDTAHSTPTVLDVPVAPVPSVGPAAPLQTHLASLAGGRLQIETVEDEIVGEDAVETGALEWQRSDLRFEGETDAKHGFVSRDLLIPMPSFPPEEWTDLISNVECDGSNMLTIRRHESLTTPFGTRAVLLDTVSPCTLRVGELDETSIGLWMFVESAEGSAVVVGVVRDGENEGLSPAALTAKLDANLTAARVWVSKLRAGRSYAKTPYAVHLNPRIAGASEPKLTLPPGFISDFDRNEVDATSHRFHQINAQGTPEFSLWYYQTNLPAGARVPAISPAPLTECDVSTPPRLGAWTFRCFPITRARLAWPLQAHPVDRFFVLEASRDRTVYGGQTEHTTISTVGEWTAEHRAAATQLIRDIEARETANDSL